VEYSADKTADTKKLNGVFDMELKIVDRVEFNEGFPFYDMVTTFMVAIAGSYSIFDKSNKMNWSKDQYMAVEGILVKGRHFIPYDMYELAQNKKITSAKYLKSCCCMLANLAYVAVEDKNDKSPEFEFFRHIRNAASHGNKFNFLNWEPASPACWRGATIDHNLKGKSNPLHGKECFGTFIGIADMIDLLADIEKQIKHRARNNQLNVESVKR
jgi:hypothetical protein